MNCKPGDLAVIVVPGRVGKVGQIVRCISLYTGRWRDADDSVRGWNIEPELRNDLGDLQGQISDARLRPIRDQPGADETITWAGLPQPSKETA